MNEQDVSTLVEYVLDERAQVERLLSPSIIQFKDNSEAMWKNIEQKCSY